MSTWNALLQEHYSGVLAVVGVQWAHQNPKPKRL
jgi:hypothetical protein